MATRKSKRKVRTHANAKPTSFTIEEAGVRLLVTLKRNHWWADVRRGSEDGSKRRRVSLRTSDESLAKDNARELAREIAKQRLIGVRPETATLSQVFEAYNRHRLPLVSNNRRLTALSTQKMFIKAWGADLVVRSLTQRHIESYSEKRKSGALTPFGERINKYGKVVKGRKPTPVRTGTVNGDFRWLSSAFNFACDHEVNGASLLSKNPLRKLRMPREKNPRRPVASQVRFDQTLKYVDQIDPAGRLRCVLSLVRYTGRRIDAVCNLRVSDVLLTSERMREVLATTGRDERLADHMPYGAIRWRPENDKQGFDELTPLSESARAALDLYLPTRSAIGDAALFPAPGTGRQRKLGVAIDEPIGRRLITRWLLKAEKLAKLPKLDQGCWHPYRRLWAVERKDLPDVDVARAGGWRDTRALKTSYQQPDPATMLRVVQHGI